MRSSRPAARRPQGAERLRANALKINQAQRVERERAGQRLRVGFQFVVAALLATSAFILVFPTARLYSAQQVEKARLQAALVAAQAYTDSLQAELDRSDDPAYLEAQARKRLSLVMPGETSYRVSDPDNLPSQQTSPSPSATPDPALPTVEPSLSAPWYWDLWDSVLEAGR